jgi:hypothetical protein
MSATLAVAVLVVALACPAHMLWSHRRGHSGCCAPSPDRTTLQARQEQLAARMDELSRSTRA